MRTTFNATFREATAGINTASERTLELQRQAATGKKIHKPSDNPSAMASSIGERADMRAIEHYTRAADSASARLTVADTIMSDVLMKLTAAQSAVLSVRGTTATQAHRDAAAEALIGIRESLLNSFNVSFRGAYLFGGSNADAAPYQKQADGSISAYQGTGAEMSIDIDNSRTVTVTFDGSALAQGAAPRDVFTIIDDAIDAVGSGDENALRENGIALDQVFERVTAAHGRIGAAMQTIDEQKLRLGQVRLAVTSRLGSIEDANMAEVLTGLSQADVAYRAALGAAGTALRVSLLDYLG